MKLKGLLSTVIAISFGVLVLAGYLFGYNADGSLSLVGELQLFILNDSRHSDRVCGAGRDL